MERVAIIGASMTQFGHGRPGSGSCWPRPTGPVSPTDDVEIGDTVRPVYVERFRGPAAGIRDSASQSWGGYRFEPRSIGRFR